MTFAGAGDPELPTTSGAGSTRPPCRPKPSSSGSHTASATVRDRAGNESATGSLTVQVDADAPSVAIVCPSVPLVLGTTASAGWTAADAESGLATPAAGSVALDTSSVGTKVATAPTAEDNVGHSAVPRASTASCSTSVASSGPSTTRRCSTLSRRGGIPVKFSLSGDQGLDVFAVGTRCHTASTAIPPRRSTPSSKQSVPEVAASRTTRPATSMSTSGSRTRPGRGRAASM